MAVFEQAISRTLQWEGGYSCDPRDPGGETLFGIARRRHPEWTGWQRVDDLKQGFPDEPHALAGVLSADDELHRLAKQFYHDNFWDYDAIESQAVANKVFDTGVNVGKAEAVQFLQRSVGTPVDGKFGPQTLEATNKANSAQLVEKLRAEQLAYYKALIQHNSSLQRFWNGWHRRAES